MSEALSQQLALLPDYLSQHLLLTLTALVAGIGLSLPLAILLTRVRGLQSPVLMLSSVVQTIPGLALLALMVPLLRQIGFLPAVIALTLYSMLPILRNTVTGIQAVDDEFVEAGQALGMTDWQLLRRVQLPLALPVIIAGIRTATVWVVGMATLSTPVGATSLGNYIFSGLQTQNYTAVTVGCVAAAALALLLDGLVRLLEIGVAQKRRELLAFTVAAFVALTVAVVAIIFTNGRTNSNKLPIVIGAKTFTEQYVLGQWLGQRLATAGFSTRQRSSLGSAIVFDALRTGEIDLYVDYTGTLWTNYMQRKDQPGRQAVLDGVREWLAREHDIKTVIPLGFENTYAFAMTSRRARDLGIVSIADLVGHASNLSLAADYEFFARPEWTSVQNQYALRFAAQRSMDSSLMYAAVAQGEVDVITAYSTDGRIAAFDLTVLADPRGAFPPYDAVLLLSAQAEARWPGLVKAVTDLENLIQAAAMRNANRAVDIDGQDLAAAAAQLEASAVPR